MYRKLIILLSIFTFIFLIGNSYKIYDFEDAKQINIEIKGEVLKEKTIIVNNGSKFVDIIDEIGLIETSDISNISKLSVLHNNQIINIPKKSNNNLVSINNGSISELSCLPGIGKNIAIKIIDYRKEYGCFHDLDEILNVPGIGTKKYEKIKQYICL